MTNGKKQNDFPNFDFDFKIDDFELKPFDFDDKKESKPQLPINARQQLENYLKKENETYLQIKNKQLSLMELSCQTDFYFSIVCESLEDREELCDALGIDWTEHLDNKLFINSRDFVSLILELKNGSQKNS